MRGFHCIKALTRFSVWFAAVAPATAGELSRDGRQFLEQHCVECHDTDTKKGGLDLDLLKFDPANATNFSTWVLVHDRVRNGERPPKKKPRPDPEQADAFTKSLASALTEAERARTDQEGRATQRRLNRYEYENALRDLLQ